jgi:hypothetical protein
MIWMTEKSGPLLFPRLLAGANVGLLDGLFLLRSSSAPKAWKFENSPLSPPPFWAARLRMGFPVPIPNLLCPYLSPSMRSSDEEAEDHLVSLIGENREIHL